MVQELFRIKCNDIFSHLAFLSCDDGSVNSDGRQECVCLVVITSDIVNIRPSEVCEDVCTEGSIGTKLLALSAEAGVKLSAFSLNDLGEGIVAHGSVSELMRDCGLDADSLFDAALKLMRDKQ